MKTIFLPLFCLFLGCATAMIGYPEQDRISFVSTFERPDLESRVDPASAEEVTGMFGREFASLPRLGVALILVNNKGRENPIVVSVQTVHLILPDGRVLKPLEVSEMIGWFDEVYGSTLGKASIEAILGRWSEDARKGILRISKGKNAGIAVVFHFPLGAASGTFPVEYVLDLGGGDQMPVKGQNIHLNVRP
jgi:hypothetical protein